MLWRITVDASIRIRSKRKPLPYVATMFARPCPPESSLPPNTEAERASTMDLTTGDATPSEPSLVDASPTKRPRQETVQESQSVPSAPSFALQLMTIMTLLTTMNLAQDSIQQSVQSLPHLVAQAVVAEMSPCATSVPSTLIQDVRQCRTMTDVIQKFGLKHYEEEGTLACQFCFKHSVHTPSKICQGRNKDTADKFSASSLLRNLKLRIISHFKSAVHEWCVERENREQLEAKRTNHIGLTIARAWPLKRLERLDRICPLNAPFYGST
ncbi:hypothetical protein CYMTET_39990 [Cymbomonas tetramitiformis]|uniref:Uncharacterized protein n=1 Tax=Cymbomonas tetramitiformis TaxID=36881 RepID=A0AAE0F525_9CHLO|nr:hypothetical protein CYMTET_39990 [Cymbomonas tetramitiformis]